jgi:hypothetical protein
MQYSMDTQKADGLWNHVPIMIQTPRPTPSAPKEMLLGGFGGFLSSTSATRRAMTRGRDENNDNDKMPSPRGFEIKFVATPLQSSSHETWRGGRFPPAPSPSYCLQITKKL